MFHITLRSQKKPRFFFTRPPSSIFFDVNFACEGCNTPTPHPPRTPILLLRLYRQAWPAPVYAASRPCLATASVGARPNRERQRRAKCKNRRPCSPFFYSGRTTGAQLPLGSVMSGARQPRVARSVYTVELSSARFRSFGFYLTSSRKTTRC